LDILGGAESVPMPFTFLHTADWQIGMKARHAGAKAEVVRSARLEAARRVIEIANERGVEAVILAGDTFEDTNVPRELVKQVVDILRASPAPVFVLPANHDPLVPHGVFEHPAWKDAAPHITVFRSVEPVAAGDALLLPCPLRSKSSFADPTEAIPPPDGRPACIRIGVAHGSVIGGAVPEGHSEDDFPIDLAATIARAQLDYLALGHWHTPSQYEIGGVVRAAYSGSHEPTKAGEHAEGGARRSGQCLVVRIASPGGAPEIEPVPTAVLEWRDVVRELRSAADLDGLRRELDSEPPASRERVLLRLVLLGALGIDEAAGIEDLRAVAEARFLHARIDCQKLSIRPGDDQWITDLPPGAPAATAKRLLEQAAWEGRHGEVARRALHLLYELSHKGGA
jgi:DNA repair exonuclease SbcCD nuclease subunit